MDIATTNIKDVFEREDIRKKFQEMLGTKATGFIVSVINSVTNDKDLATADRNSILFAAATAAALDLPINANLGFAYIIPYKGRAQFQIGYKGFIQLAQRSGQFQTIAATPIYEGQLVEQNPLTGFKFDFTKRTGDKVLGYAGYFKLLNGFEKIIYMTSEELKKHGKKYSQSYKKGYGLWEDNFDAMATKTVLKLLLSKFAPLSIEMQKAVLTDQGIINNWEGDEIDYIDNKPLSIEEVSLDKEELRIEKFLNDATYTEQLEEAYEYCSNLPDEHKLKILYTKRLEELKKKVD